VAARSKLVPSAHRGVGRIAAILEFVCAADAGVRLTQIAAHLGAPKSSVHGLLRGLIGVGYLSERDGLYRLGPGLAVLVGKTGPKLLIDAARPELEGLVEQFGETATLGVRVGGNIVYIDQVISPQAIRYVAPLHMRRLLTRSSMGKIYLAHMARASADELLRESNDGDRVAPSNGLLPEEIEQIRERGVAFNTVAFKRQELTANVTAVAAGVWGLDRLVGAISVIGPAERMAPALDEIANALHASAARIGVIVQKTSSSGGKGAGNNRRLEDVGLSAGT
jgi:DNA-binding IclR family transcriptional regulator